VNGHGVSPTVMHTAVGTLPLLNACTHIAGVQYSKAASPTSVRSATWQSSASYMCESCSTLQIFITKRGHQDSDACRMCLHSACTTPSSGNIYK